jgi:hypothetical protein
MNQTIKSIRPFIGSKSYSESRSFYRELGFEEMVLGDNFCVFEYKDFGFYLQDAYVKDWIDNTMIFLEVEKIEDYYSFINDLDLSAKFKTVRLKPIENHSWGKVFFLHDPCGILWQIGEFA